MTGILGGGFLKDQVAWMIVRGKWKGFSHKMLEDDEDDTVDGRNPAPPGMYKTL